MSNRFSLTGAFRKAALPAVLAASSFFVTQDLKAQTSAPDAPANVATAPAANASSEMSALDVGGVTFVSPWLLLGLGSLPVLWFLLRAMPHKPKVETLPTINFLSDLFSEEQKPDGMPWWQKTLRLSVLGAAITGLAYPILNDNEALDGEGPVVLVVDNDWASAPNWPALSQEMKSLIEKAEHDERQIFFVSTAVDSDSNPIQLHGPYTSERATQYVDNLSPFPWEADREQALEALKTMDLGADPALYWMSNGLNDDENLDGFVEELNKLGALTVLRAGGDAQPYLIVPPTLSGKTLAVKVLRANTDEKEVISLSATDQAGNPLLQEDVVFAAGKDEVEVIFDVPDEVRNQLARLNIDGQNSAGAVAMLDERFRHRPVGVVQTDKGQVFQQLLDETHYVETALENYSNLRKGSVESLLDRSLSVMILTDSVSLTDEEEDKLAEWVNNGGTLLRFAGPRLASEPEKQELLPVTVRSGVKSLGARSSGHQGIKIGDFPEGSPLAGIDVSSSPMIKRKVMAQPGVDTEEKTWARLSDGTPLVTGSQRGAGWTVLVHTTADTNWSNLPLSKIFIDMMRTVIAHSQGVIDDQKNESGLYEPVRLLDGFGQMTSYTGAATELPVHSANDVGVGPEHPPGLYGSGGLRYAHNLGAAVTEMEPLTNADLPSGAKSELYAQDDKEIDLKDVLLASAFALALADMLVLLGQQGYLGRRRTKQPKPKLGL
jgi:hypothetical protein